MSSVGSDEMINDWRKMLEKLTTDKDWCKMVNSKDLPILWKHYLGTNLIPLKLKDLIRRVLAIPVGSSDVERAFSILTHIWDQRRSGLTPEHIQDLLRFRINGPKPREFNGMKYAKTWRGLRTDDPTQIQQTKKQLICIE